MDYNNKMRASLEQRCEFVTERLHVKSWRSQQSESGDLSHLVKTVLTLLTPAVTQSLPEGWQAIKDEQMALNWIQERAEESCFLVVQKRANQAIVGFLFLYEVDANARLLDLHLGYLLAETEWGQGFGNELIEGLNEWCLQAGDIHSVTGGVEVRNKASIRVLQKNGYQLISADTPSDDTVFYKHTFEI